MLKKQNHLLKSFAQARISLQKSQRNDPYNQKDKINHHQNIEFQPIIYFDCRHYPFKNQTFKQQKMYKTTLFFEISQQRIKKLTNLSHPNLINIQKIVKGHPKSTPSKTQKNYYSFYYQYVPYSLKDAVKSKNSDSQLLKKLKLINFRSLLKQLTIYLINCDFYHQFRLEDIGVMEDGNIKIYISPFNVYRQSQYQKSDVEILHYHEKLVDWWETVFPEALTYKNNNFLFPIGDGIDNEGIKSTASSFIEKQTSQIMGQNLSINHDIMRISKPLQNDIMQSNNISIPQVNNCNFPYNTMTTSCGKKGLRQCINPKFLVSSIKSFQTQLTRRTSLQIQKMKRISQEFNKIKKRHSLTKQVNDKLRKESDDKIFTKMRQFNNFKNHNNIYESANIQNLNKPMNIQQNINCINIYRNNKKTTKKHQFWTQPVFSYNISPQSPINLQKMPNYRDNLQNNDDDDNSIDSFDIDDIGVEQENTKKQYQFCRHSMDLNNQPTLQDHTKKKLNNQIKVANNFTESAGPLQFKNIYNMLKPQFLARKSNIYEDPHEDQSQYSKQPERLRKKCQISDICQVSKPDSSKKRNNMINNPINIQTSKPNLLSKKKSLKINQKIRNAVEKTKNAIDLLNRVKSSKSHLNRKLTQF